MMYIQDELFPTKPETRIPIWQERIVDLYRRETELHPGAIGYPKLFDLGTYRPEHRHDFLRKVSLKVTGKKQEFIDQVERTLESVHEIYDSGQSEKEIARRDAVRLHGLAVGMTALRDMVGQFYVADFVRQVVDYEGELKDEDLGSRGQTLMSLWLSLEFDAYGHINGLRPDQMIERRIKQLFRLGPDA